MRYTEHGLDLSFDEVCEVLAFWDRHCVGDVPAAIGDPALGGSPYHVIWYVSTRAELTPALVAELRDWAYPWEDAAAEQVHLGETAVVRGRLARRVSIRGVGSLLPNFVSGVVCWAFGDGTMTTTGPGFSVQARRPRVARVRLGDVEPGQVVMLGGFRHRVVRDYTTEDDRIRAVRLDTWESHVGSDNIPVEIVEEP